MQRGALESGLLSRPLDASRLLPIQTTPAVVAVETPLRTALFCKSKTPAFLLHRVVAARVLRNQLICGSLRMESICSGAILNERFSASPMISNDRSTKRWLAISDNRFSRLEWQAVAGWGSKVEGTSPSSLPANKMPRGVHYTDPLHRVNTRIIKAGGCMSGVFERSELRRSSLVV